MSLFKNQTRLAMAYTNEVGDKIYPVIVDIKKGIKSTEEIQFMSSDINTGVLSVAFIQGNDNYNVSGAEVVCSVMRPDASTLDIPCTIIENNIVEVPLGINGTSQDGIYSFDFKVFKGGNKVVGTPIMNYSVSLSISNDNAVLEDDRLPVLTMLMTQVSELHDRIDEAVVKANTATEATKVATANAIEATTTANETITKVAQDTANAIAEVNATSDTMVENVNNAISSMDTTVNSKISEMTATVNDKISEVDTAKNDMINDVSSTKANMVTEVTNAKNEMTATVTSKVNEVEGRFNALTASQQQSSEVIDARDGETSLKARLDRDIEKANKELDKIKKLEESTVSTVTTESNFTTVEATNNGYFEDVKLEGKTLVVNSDNEVVESGTDGATLKSVGQSASEDGIDEIVVSSCTTKNLFNKASWHNQKKTYIKLKPNTQYTVSCTYDNPGDKFSGFYGVLTDVNGNLIIKNGSFVFHYNLLDIVYKNTFITDSTGVVILVVTGHSFIESYKSHINIQIEEGSEATSYVENQTDKKRLLYYNEETQTWEKPVLREWDSIEKHTDGKYYYHQRSGEVVLNGSESWLIGTEGDTVNGYTIYVIAINNITTSH